MTITEEQYTDVYFGETHYFHDSASGQAFFFDPNDPKSKRGARREAGRASREALKVDQRVRPKGL